jgi:thiol-disulfide isomerase/thioredoxin
MHQQAHCEGADADAKVEAGRRRVLLLALAAALAAAGPAGAAAPAPATAAFDAAQYRGKVLYLDFWASWCGPCQVSFPYMNRLVTAHPNSDFALVAVNVDHDRAAANAFLHRLGGAVPVVFDPSGALARRYRVTAMPTSLLIGRDGRTRYVHSGFFPEQMALYDSQIAELMHER